MRQTWNAKGTPITVELEGVPGSVSEKVLTAAAGGDAPEVIHTHPRDYHAWLNAGALVPLEEGIRRGVARRQLGHPAGHHLAIWRWGCTS